MIENAINIIDRQDKLRHLNVEEHGKTKEEQLFAVALDLSITWINRVLFLKLLEAQIIKYHSGNTDFAFLSIDKLGDYNDLDSLFFDILARKDAERKGDLKARFSFVPYLNSSLFEKTDIEDKTIFIGSLQNNILMSLYPKTILPDAPHSMRPLEYLLKFLNAYDFAGESSEDIREDNRSLISASVLGLIFEKINGYKDGSFFTPAFITMYMCRETISKVVIQKFNDAKKWNCQTITDLYNKIDNTAEANSIFNSIRICDPAVGSGHFLVSALNEMIKLKSELGILVDRNNKRLKDYQITIENDELMITDGDNDIFQYTPHNHESQRVQETLFHEKQTIIENCLFGVDINSNSVKICQLRLWIELLKNAYYKDKSSELETLPNIDINIKCGNSLISRFDLRDNYAENTALQLNITRATKRYKEQVYLYKNANDKLSKNQIKLSIEEEKSFFYQINDAKDADFIAMKNARNELAEHTRDTFEMFQDEAWQKKAAELEQKTAELEKIYKDKVRSAFEWRFEFPEVLDDNGNFVGFDLIIGNPPYVFARNSKSKGMTDKDKKYFYSNYILSEYQINLYPLFVEAGTKLLKNGGSLCLITPNNWLTLSTNSKLRRFVLENSDIHIINFYKRVFESADVDSAVFIFQKIQNCDRTEKVLLAEWDTKYNLIARIEKQKLLSSKDCLISIEALKANEIFDLLNKIENYSERLSDIADVKAGLKAYETGKGDPPLTEEMKKNRVWHSTRQHKSYLKYLDGRNVMRYSFGWSGEFLKYGNNLAAPRNNFDLFSTPRILVRQIPSPLPYCINACYTKETFLNDLNSMNIIYIKVSPKYLLGILNSKLISYWFAHKFGKLQRGIFPQFKINELAQFPVPNISTANQQPISLW
ncbi:hypothetical protein AGMMS50229_09930 [Campylobacterota bacterium]|nr:hypothetical protein AGMMS50229_09930 [Campylobacterota bacterium]